MLRFSQAYFYEIHSRESVRVPNDKFTENSESLLLPPRKRDMACVFLSDCRLHVAARFHWLVCAARQKFGRRTFCKQTRALQSPEYSRAVPGQRYCGSVEYYEACTQGRKLRSMLPVLLEQTYSTGPSLSDTFDYCKQFSRVGKTRRELVGRANTRIIARPRLDGRENA